MFKIQIFLFKIVLLFFSQSKLSVLSYSPLNGLEVTRISDLSKVDIGLAIGSSKSGSMIIFGTYAADFNTIEYGQRLRYYIPLLKEKGINNFKMIINSTPEAAKQLASFIALPG